MYAKERMRLACYSSVIYVGFNLIEVEERRRMCECILFVFCSVFSVFFFADVSMDVSSLSLGTPYSIRTAEDKVVTDGWPSEISSF